MASGAPTATLPAGSVVPVTMAHPLLSPVAPTTHLDTFGGGFPLHAAFGPVMSANTAAQRTADDRARVAELLQRKLSKEDLATRAGPGNNTTFAVRLFVCFVFDFV